MRVSVIIPITRIGAAEATLASVGKQQTRHEVEVLTVGPTGIVRVEDLNPALRRNSAARAATGEVLAFIDDDAVAAPDWIETAVEHLTANPNVVALGGPDPSPQHAPAAELLSDTLLATPWIGSGVLCHVAPNGLRKVERPSDVALVNLFVRKEAFERCGGFDASIGFIGEDTDLVAKLMKIGEVNYHSGVIVHHRRRKFPGPYLRQRWRYRLKTGRMFSAYRSDPRLWILLVAPIAFLLLLVSSPPVGITVFVFYLALCLSLGVRATRLPVGWWPLLPFAFLLHHATYFLATWWGILKRESGKP